MYICDSDTHAHVTCIIHSWLQLAVSVLLLTTLPDARYIDEISFASFGGGGGEQLDEFHIIPTVLRLAWDL